MGRWGFLGWYLLALLLLFNICSRTPNWYYFAKVHEYALEHQGESFCYEVKDSNHYSDGWYCLTYWGKTKGTVPSVYTEEDEYVWQSQ